MKPRLPRFTPKRGTPWSATRLAPSKNVPSPPSTTRASIAPPRASADTARAPGNASASSASATRSHPSPRRIPPRSAAISRASGLPRLSRKPNRIAARLLRDGFVENGNRQTVELAVRALRHNLVEDLRLRIGSDPTGEYFAQLLTILGLRGGEDLCPHQHALTPSRYPVRMLRFTITSTPAKRLRYIPCS